MGRRQEIVDIETQLFHDRFGVLSYDDARDILELRWLAGTEAMTDDDFMRWLEQFAAAAEEHRAPFLLIDTRAFQHYAGAHVWPWGDEHIIPRYNQVGVKKFAFEAAGFPRQRSYFHCSPSS